MSKWIAGTQMAWGANGTIVAEEDRGRRYFHVRVRYPESSGWWPRTTETTTIDEAREWIKTQEDDYRTHLRNISASATSAQERAKGGSDA